MTCVFFASGAFIGAELLVPFGAELSLWSDVAVCHKVRRRKVLDCGNNEHSTRVSHKTATDRTATDRIVIHRTASD